MTARLLDGVAMGRAIRQEVAAGRRACWPRSASSPGWPWCSSARTPPARCTSGARARRARRRGCTPSRIRLPATTSQAELLATIDQLNADPAIHGMLVQLPLPKAMNSEQVLRRIDPRKDVDGFHPENVGKLVTGDPTALPPRHAVRRAADADPLGDRDQGRPRRDRRPVQHRRQADGQPPHPAGPRRRRHRHRVPLAHPRPAGHRTRRPTSSSPPSARPEFVTADMVQPGRRGHRRRHQPGGRRDPGEGLPPRAATSPSSRWPQIASAITPVPGGVGPMTIAMLLKNTLQAAELTRAG